MDHYVYLVYLYCVIECSVFRLVILWGGVTQVRRIMWDVRIFLRRIGLGDWVLSLRGGLTVGIFGVGVIIASGKSFQ